MESFHHNQTKKRLNIAVSGGFLALALMVNVATAGNNQKGGQQLQTQGRIFDHYIVIVLENKDYDEAVNDPYFQSLMKQGALFSNFTAVSHPSYPNYLAMAAGSTFDISSDTQTTLKDQSIADLLEAQNLTWKNYAENYPGNCFLGSSKGTYARKHVPFLSFQSIQKNPKRCNLVVSGDEFKTDWKSHAMPNYAFYSPNLNDDGHDTNLPTATEWLQKFLTPILADSKGMEKTLIEVTFDESESYTGNNQIFTLFIGPMVKAGVTVDTAYNHYDALRTVEDNFSLGTLNKEDTNATAIQDVWVN